MSTELLEETLRRIFRKHCGPAECQQAESEGFLPACFDALDDAGLVYLGVGEDAGGSGGSMEELALYLRMAGANAVPLPLAECTLTGGWLVESAGLKVPEGPLTVPVPRAGDELVLTGRRLSGHLGRVPWGGRAAAVAAIAVSDSGPAVVLFDPAMVSVTPGRNVAGEPRDRLELHGLEIDGDAIGIPPAGVAAELELRGALSRALLLAGACEAASQMTLAYASERRQFGRPIGTFQSVANRIVRMASEAEAAILCATVAAERFATLGAGDPVALNAGSFDVAVAKASVSRSAVEVAAEAHQVHGAIGMTQEYPLHHLTRRIWSWCQEWGTGRNFCVRLGEAVASTGASGLWPRVAVGLEEGAPIRD